MTDDELLRHFHTQIRLGGHEAGTGPGSVHDTDGPVRRRYPVTPGASYCMVEAPEGLGDDPDRWIARTVAFFTERGERVEWKTFSYDEPADIGERLVRHGFEREDQEALLIGEAADLVHDVELPPGVRLREVTAVDRHLDYDRIAALMRSTYGNDDDGFTEELRSERAAAPDLLEIVVAEETADGPVLCAGWIRYTQGTDFASMWGGSTLAEWRRRGLYRSTVVWRARRAVARGYRFMRLDTSPDSRPILTNLGLRHLADTTPYVLDPR